MTEDKIYDLLLSFKVGDVGLKECTDSIMALHDDSITAFKKNRLDLLNWAKSELSNEINPKLGKTMNPYRIEKMRFLSKVIELL